MCTNLSWNDDRFSEIDMDLQSMNALLVSRMMLEQCLIQLDQDQRQYGATLLTLHV